MKHDHLLILGISHITLNTEIPVLAGLTYSRSTVFRNNKHTLSSLAPASSMCKNLKIRILPQH